MMGIFKKRLSILFVVLICCLYGKAQQLSLQSIYKENNPNSLDSIAKGYTPKQKGIPKSDSLLTAFYKYYTESIEKGVRADVKIKTNYTSNNFFLQPAVTFVFTNEINFAEVKTVKRQPSEYEDKFYRYNPDTVYDEANRYYHILDSQFKFTPKIVVKSFVDKVNRFLTEPGFLTKENALERKNRALFLSKYMNLNKGNFKFPNTDIIEYEFTYGYFIDRVVLNRNQNQAVIQCRIDKKTSLVSREYLFENTDGEWKCVDVVRNSFL